MPIYLPTYLPIYLPNYLYASYLPKAVSYYQVTCSFSVLNFRNLKLLKSVIPQSCIEALKTSWWSSLPVHPLISHCLHPDNSSICATLMTSAAEQCVRWVPAPRLPSTTSGLVHIHSPNPALDTHTAPIGEDSAGLCWRLWMKAASRFLLLS